jgi:hypothetical protein
VCEVVGGGERGGYIGEVLEDRVVRDGLAKFGRLDANPPPRKNILSRQLLHSKRFINVGDSCDTSLDSPD